MTIETRKGIPAVGLALVIAGAWLACTSSNLSAQTETMPTPTPAGTRIAPQKCPAPHTEGITIIGAEPREEYCSQSGKVSPPPVGGITFTDVIRLSQAGLSDNTIIAEIKMRLQLFNLLPDQLLQLKNTHVSDRVIEAMTEPSAIGVQAPSGKSAPTVSPPAKEPPVVDSIQRQRFAEIDNSREQAWQSTTKSDPLTGKSYMLYVLTGKYLAPPDKGSDTAPRISLRCDPSAHHGSGEFIAGFIEVNAVIDLENGHNSTVRYRLDDGNVQTADDFEVGYSTDFQAISVHRIFLNNLLWGHMIPHKPHTSDQVHTVVISVQEHLGGNIVMEFEMPDAQGVGAACGTSHR